MEEAGASEGYAHGRQQSYRKQTNDEEAHWHIERIHMDSDKVTRNRRKE